MKEIIKSFTERRLSLIKNIICPWAGHSEYGKHLNVMADVLRNYYFFHNGIIDLFTWVIPLIDSHQSLRSHALAKIYLTLNILDFVYDKGDREDCMNISSPYWIHHALRIQHLFPSVE
jgi:hypothetical protein